MSQAVDSARRPREFGLWAALAVSVAAHGVLAVLFLLLGSLLPPEVPPPREEPLLQFTFDRGPERPEATEPPRGTVPDPTPEQVAPPAVTEQPTPRGVTASPSRAALPSPAVPPSPPPSTAERRPARPEPEPEPEPEDPPRRETEAAEDERRGVEAPERPESTAAAGSAPPRSRPPDQLPDLRDALRKYQQDLERAKANRAEQGTTGSKQSVFVPDMSRMPVQGTPYGILEFQSRDYDWSDYYRQIYWEILKAWYRRMYATTEDFEKWAHQNNQWMLGHQSRISFVIHRSGNVSGIVLETPSGCVPLDRSAMDGLSEVILVPLPADFPRDREQVKATFIATGEIATMRTYFGYLKRINFF